MRKLTANLAILLLGWVSIAAYAGEYNFKPGMWETTTKMKVTGVPKQMAAMMVMAPMTEQGCMTEKDIIFNSDKECKYDKKRISPKKVKFKMACKTDSGVQKGRGEINFNGKKVSGWFEMTSMGPTGPIKMKHIFTAKYIGACR